MAVTFKFRNYREGKKRLERLGFRVGVQNVYPDPAPASYPLDAVGVEPQPLARISLIGGSLSFTETDNEHVVEYQGRLKQALKIRDNGSK